MLDLLLYRVVGEKLPWLVPCFPEEGWLPLGLSSSGERAHPVSVEREETEEGGRKDEEERVWESDEDTPKACSLPPPPRPQKTFAFGIFGTIVSLW